MQEPVAGNLDDKVSPKQKIALQNGNASLRELCAQLHRKVADFLQSEPPNQLMHNVQRQTAISLAVLKEALDTYGLDKLALSYNGGKDCLVLLILWLVTIYKHYGLSQSASSTLATDSNSARHFDQFPETLECVYIQPSHSFSEVDDFVRESSRQYHLEVCHLSKPMKTSFEEYLEMKPNTEAIFVGTRRTDPHGAALTHFTPTDGNWPKFMRCQPVIDWHYKEIWAFIRHFDIPYCPLYDQGFTSLGGTKDTFANPKLRIQDPSGTTEGPAKYRPAYELLDDNEERLGRYTA